MSRIEPLRPPYPPFFDQAMARVMPAGVEPLALFRTVAVSERAWTKFAGGSLLDKGPLPLREREIVILRTTARCDCSYEWGVHATTFGARAGLSEAQIADTAAPDPAPQHWTDAERALIQTVDALLDRKRLGDAEHDRIATHYNPEQLLEIVQLAGFYHGVALICGAFDLAPEPGMSTLPA